MAGGAGVEYYFGYKLPQNDLLCEDWRSRERSWDFAALALGFFARQEVPLDEMEPADALVGNAAEDDSRYAFAKKGELYLVYLPAGGTTPARPHGSERVLRRAVVRSRATGARCRRHPAPARSSAAAAG